MRSAAGVRFGLAAAALLPVACSSHEPRLTTDWATRARAACSAATPDDEVLSPRAEYGPPDARERDDLTDLDEEEGLEEVVVHLAAGVFNLDAPVRIERAAFVLQGEGSHRTRLELDTRSYHALSLLAAPRVELRGLTVVGLSGGGIRIEGCPDVRVDDVCFAGARFGLSLEGCVAAVGTSVFAGCEAGIDTTGGRLAAREVAFVDNWAALRGRGTIDLEACAFVDNREAVAARLDDGARVVSCMFAGDAQDLAWTGRPGLVTACLVRPRELEERVGRRTNRTIRVADDFPDALPSGLPPDMDLAAVHLALERSRLRGDPDPPGRLRELALERAEEHARRSQRLLTLGDVAAARSAAHVALRYLGDDVALGDAPEVVRDVAGLVQ